MPTTIRNGLQEDDANKEVVGAQEFTLLDESGDALTLEATVVSDFLSHVNFDGIFDSEAASPHLMHVDGDGDYVHYFEDEDEEVDAVDEMGEKKKGMKKEMKKGMKGMAKGMSYECLEAAESEDAEEVDEAAMAKTSGGKPSFAGTKYSKWPTRHEKKVYPAAYHDEEDEDEESHVKEGEILTGDALAGYEVPEGFQVRKLPNGDVQIEKVIEAAKKGGEKPDFLKKKIAAAKDDEKKGDDDKKDDDKKSEARDVTTRGALVASMAYETIEEAVDELDEGEFLEFLPGDVAAQIVNPDDLADMFEHYVGTLVEGLEWDDLTLAEKAQFHLIANLLDCKQDEGVFEAASDAGKAQFLDLAHALLSQSIVRHSTPVTERMIKKKTASARAMSKRTRKKPKSGKKKMQLKMDRKKNKRADVKAKRSRGRRKNKAAINKRAAQLRNSTDVDGASLFEYPVYGHAEPNGKYGYGVESIEDAVVTFEVIEAAKKTPKKDADKDKDKETKSDKETKTTQDKDAKDKGDSTATHESLTERAFMRAGPGLAAAMVETTRQPTPVEATSAKDPDDLDESEKKPEPKKIIIKEDLEPANVSEGARLSAGMLGG